MLSQVLADGAAVKAEFKANLREGFSLTSKHLSLLTILIGEATLPPCRIELFTADTTYRISVDTDPPGDFSDAKALTEQLLYPRSRGWRQGPVLGIVRPRRSTIYVFRRDYWGL